MKMKLLSGLVLLFAAFLFCENASAQCPVDPKWKELMDKGKYKDAAEYVIANKDEWIKKYGVFCFNYFGAETIHKSGLQDDLAVSIMKQAIKALPDSYKENSTEWHKAVHWAIELAEKELAANKIDEAKANLNWALEGSLKAGSCPGYPIESKDSHHIQRLSELNGDIAVIKGNFANAIKFYEFARSTPEVKNKIANANEKISASLKFEMVKIPAGSFKMGASPEKRKWATGEFYDWKSINPDEKLRKSQEPEHKVTISKDFYLGKYEVTQAQWKAVMGSVPNSCYDGFDVGGDDKPVVCVSWNDIQVYIKMLNARGNGTYRLPTEAEWEYAARAGTSSTYFWGNDEKDACKYGNVADETANNGNVQLYRVKCKDGYKHASPVGKFLPNPFGLYDMSGNASEWCQDFYGDYQKENQIDPTGPGSSDKHVVRGGDWDDKYFSPGFHAGYLTKLGSNDVGFRLIKEN